MMFSGGISARSGWRGDFVECLRLVRDERARRFANERAHVGGNVDCGADVVAERPHVGSFAAGDPQTGGGRRLDPSSVSAYTVAERARRSTVLPLTGQLVQSLAFVMHGREHRRHLHDLAHEARNAPPRS